MRGRLILALLLGSMQLAAADPFAGRRFALVIGVDSFDDEYWSDLSYATKDAADVARALEGEFDQVKLISGDTPATRKSVLDGLRELAAQNVSDLDTVVIYLSTHGTLARDAGGELVRVLVLQDTEHADPLHTGLTYDALMKALEGLRSKRKLLILAACHAGAGKSSLQEDLRRELDGIKAPFFEEPPFVAGEGQIVLAASAWGEAAREDRGLQNDIYTHFFLEAVRGFDRNGDGATTALEAHDYARARTIEFTKGRQRPTLSAEIVGDAPIVLRGSIQRRGDPVIAAYGEMFAGARVEVDGREKGVLPGGFALTPGRHRVRVLHSSRPQQPLIDTEIDAEAGGTVWLESLERLESLESRSTFRLRAAGGFSFVRNSAVAGEYVPSHPSLSLNAELELGPRLWLGLLVEPAYSSAGIRINDAGIDARQALWLVNAGATGTWTMLQLDRFQADLGARFGWSLGHRRASTATRQVSEVVAFPFGGLELRASVPLVSGWSLEATAGVDLILPQIERRIRAVASDRYAVGLALAL